MYCYICEKETKYNRWSDFNDKHLIRKHNIRIDKNDYYKELHNKYNGKFDSNILDQNKKVLCKVCNKEILVNDLGNFLTRHLRKVHNIQTNKEYYDRYIKKDGEGICPTCGKESRFIDINKGYNKFCSNKCIGLNKEIQDKKKNSIELHYGENAREIIADKNRETCLERYGQDNVFKLEDIKKKSKLTRLKKYGDENFNNRESAKKTNIQRYGVDSPLKNETIKKKLIKTNNERYGGNCCFSHIFYRDNKRKNWKIINKNRIINIINKLNLNIEFIRTIPEEDSYEFKCNKCNSIFQINSQLFRLRNHNKHTVCTICNSPELSHTSYSETEILEFIKSLNIENIQNNNREIIKPYEVDIFLQDKNVAIEFNGLYWHSEKYRLRNYHKMKTELCEAKGIHLIHIYEDDWKYKREIVKSLLKELLIEKDIEFLNDNYEIREIGKDETKNFLNTNHILGFCESNINIGLYSNNILESIMTFKQNEGNYELIRLFGNNIDKIFEYFLNKYKPKEVISYVDRSWIMNNGKTIYDKLGFKFEKVIKENYCYIVEDRRTNKRIKGCEKIYDCGYLKYVYQK